MVISRLEILVHLLRVLTGVNTNHDILILDLSIEFYPAQISDIYR